jgi:hypothetical protein
MIDQKTLTLTVAGLALFLGGVFAGHFTAPTKIVESKTHTETTIKLQTIEQKVDTAELLKLVRDEMAKISKDVNKVTHKVTKPDGTVDETVTETDKSKIETGTKTTVDSSKTDKTVTNTHLLDEKLTVDQKFKLVENSGATWSVGVFAGWQTLGAAPSFNLIPNYDRLVIGASVDRRLFGPVWGGVFATTTGLFGLDLRLVR